MRKIDISNEEALKVAKMPLRLRGTWITWKLGFEPYFLMSRETYYKHYAELKSKWEIDIKTKAGE